MALPDNILRSSTQSLTSKQRTEYEKHPVFAEALLMGIPKLNKAAEIIRSQHERFNGEGFPDRRVGEGIPIESRILAIARDYFDLIGGRLVGKKLTPAEAISFIKTDEQRRYDPNVVRAFETVVQHSSDSDITLSEICVDPRMLSIGMRLTRDLQTPTGMLLLNKDHELTEELITKLVNLQETVGSKLDVYILKESIKSLDTEKENHT